jgi:hypothetical protein
MENVGLAFLVGKEVLSRTIFGTVLQGRIYAVEADPSGCWQLSRILYEGHTEESEAYDLLGQLADSCEVGRISIE